MSIFDNDNNNKNAEIQKELLKEFSELRKELLNITEYSSRELKAISVLSRNKYMRSFFVSDNFIKLKRKMNNILNKDDINKSDLKSIEKIMKEISKLKNLDYVSNKKHLKRKFEKTLLKMSKYVSDSINAKDDSGFINFFNRDKR